eukprot:577107-Lingulodinium_polyedra.AAC.1
MEGISAPKVAVMDRLGPVAVFRPEKFPTGVWCKLVISRRDQLKHCGGVVYDGEVARFYRMVFAVKSPRVVVLVEMEKED